MVIIIVHDKHQLAEFNFYQKCYNAENSKHEKDICRYFLSKMLVLVFMFMKMVTDNVTLR